MPILIILLVVAITALTGCSRSTHQKDFATTDEAVAALIMAARSKETNALLDVLGAEAEPSVHSGDPVQDTHARERFLQAYETAHSLETGVTGEVTLEVGEDKWPFPFPLVEKDGRWRFDTAAGTEEIVNRRVGENELATIQSCLAFVDAEREYYLLNPENDSLLHFAQKLISTDGKKDGLYWSASGEEIPSPLGEAFAHARGEGYLQSANPKAEPFHGYIYRLLSKQGANAKGGAYDYLVNDKMMGGFALLAFPTEYGSSGVMSFMVNHDGVVFSKDLGPDTAKVAAAMDAFDPDESWKREAAIEWVAASK